MDYFIKSGLSPCGCLRFTIILFLTISLAGCHTFDLIELEPSGPIARDIEELFWTTVALMSLVLIPVFAMSVWFIYNYRASNEKATYMPDWDRSTRLEWLVWLVPCLIITVLAGMTWVFSHRLSPYRVLQADVPPLTIQVVALDWKWLFIYPEQNIATVNEVSFPVGRPIDFNITSDTVMNSFFIPRLGGQIYAMAGMNTQLHLIADAPGRYLGENTQFSGRGFPYQNFVAIAVDDRDFNAWVQHVKQSSSKLDLPAFDQLASASINYPVSYYGSVASELFETILAKYSKAGAANTRILPGKASGASEHVR